MRHTTAPPNLRTLNTPPSWRNAAGRVDRSACLIVRSRDVWRSALLWPDRTFQGRLESGVVFITAAGLRFLHDYRPERMVDGDYRTAGAPAMAVGDDPPPPPPAPPPSARSRIHKQRVSKRKSLHLWNREFGLGPNPNRGRDHPRAKMLGLRADWYQPLRVERWRFGRQTPQYWLICPGGAAPPITREPPLYIDPLHGERYVPDPNRPPCRSSFLLRPWEVAPVVPPAWGDPPRPYLDPEDDERDLPPEERWILEDMPVYGHYDKRVEPHDEAIRRRLRTHRLYKVKRFALADPRFPGPAELKYRPGYIPKHKRPPTTSSHSPFVPSCPRASVPSNSSSSPFVPPCPRASVPSCLQRARYLYLPLCTEAELYDSELAWNWMNSLTPNERSRNLQVIHQLTARYHTLFPPNRILLCQKCLALRWGLDPEKKRQRWQRANPPPSECFPAEPTQDE